MTSPDIVKSFVKAVETCQFPYMVVGSFSSNFYGISRSTHDLDLVVELAANSISRLAQSLGPEFFVDPQTSFETVTFTVRNVVFVKDSPFKIELFHLGEDEHDQERFRRRQRQELDAGLTAWVATAEDVIVTKLRWLLQADRRKDREDVRGVIGMRSDRLDWNYIESWCDRHGSRHLLDELRRL